jgi:hypothetical protein
MSTGIHTSVQRGISNGIHAGINAGTQPSFSSSKFLEKEKNLTTTEPGLLDDPELRFWKTEGITSGSVRGWLKEPWAIENSVSTEMLLKSLRHLRYEIVENGQTPDKPDNWAYKIIVKNFGEYESKNYRSYESIKLEKIEKERAELVEVRKRLAIAERELAFEKILANPEGSEYQDLLGRVDNSFAIELGGQELEHALRDVYFGVKS